MIVPRGTLMGPLSDGVARVYDRLNTALRELDQEEGFDRADALEALEVLFKQAVIADDAEKYEAAFGLP